MKLWDTEQDFIVYTVEMEEIEKLDKEHYELSKK